MGVNKVIFNTLDGLQTLIDISDSTVTAETLAKGETAYGADSEKITGAMEASAKPKLQVKSVVPSEAALFVRPDSGYDGLEYVYVYPVMSSLQTPISIEINPSGVITASFVQTEGYVYSGTPKSQMQLSTYANMTIMPSSIDQELAPGKYLAGTVTIKGDADLVPENIVFGKTIFGVQGTAEIGGGGSGDSFENDIITKHLSGIYRNDTIYYVGPYVFAGCYDLFAVDLPYVDHIEGSAFMECSSLMAVVLRNTESVCGQGSDNFSDTPISDGVGFVYVPSALIEDYRASDFWTNLSPDVEFRAIEDYTLDGTVTGEMDWERIESERGDAVLTWYILDGDPIEPFPVMETPITDMMWFEWVESGVGDEFGISASITDEGYVVFNDMYYITHYFDGADIDDLYPITADFPVCYNDQNAIYLLPMECFE